MPKLHDHPRWPWRGLLAGVLLAASGTLAMAMEIPLPALAGFYDDSTGMVTITVDLGEPVQGIVGVRIRMVGTITPGTILYEGELRPWGASFFASFLEPPGGFWYVGVGGGVDGAFDETVEFQSFLDPDWEFLTDGTGELDFEFLPAMHIPEAIPITSPTGTITAVSLMIELAVANEVSTWSQLKALYR